MQKKNVILHIIVILCIIIVTSFLSVNISNLHKSIYGDTDYKKLGLDLYVEHYTVYEEDSLGVYKVYKISNYSIDDITNQLENNPKWSKTKFYEYLMEYFYEDIDNRFFDIDRDNLYYYYENGIYAIFDIKNCKLYYLDYYIPGSDADHSRLLDIKIDNYIDKEVYCIKKGWQGDGCDYYTYKFTKEKGKEVVEALDKSALWSKEKLSEKVLNYLEYNDEVHSIENGYYHHKLICRTRDDYKKVHFTEEEATGCEIGVYDVDNNTLYYYWQSI